MTDAARRLSARAPGPARALYRRARHAYRRGTSGAHLLPDYLILGAERGGTTSLYSYLVRQPLVGPASTKEVHYFDLAYGRGAWWYRRHFPTVAAKAVAERRHGGRFVTGEASPYYLFHPHVPPRVRELLPDVRLVALLRDPVARAYSSYQLMRRQGHEPLSFEEAIAREEERLAPGIELLARDPLAVSLEHRRFSYVARGLYAEQLERWLALFPREQLLVLPSEELFADPAATVARVLEHLGLPPEEEHAYPAFNQRPYEGLAPETEAALRERFREPNARLAELLGRDPGWG